MTVFFSTRERALISSGDLTEGSAESEGGMPKVNAKGTEREMMPQLTWYVEPNHPRKSPGGQDDLGPQPSPLVVPLETGRRPIRNWGMISGSVRDKMCREGARTDETQHGTEPVRSFMSVGTSGNSGDDDARPRTLSATWTGSRPCAR
jgi:hypothetical protein